MDSRPFPCVSKISVLKLLAVVGNKYRRERLHGVHIMGPMQLCVYHLIQHTNTQIGLVYTTCCFQANNIPPTLSWSENIYVHICRKLWFMWRFCSDHNYVYQSSHQQQKPCLFVYRPQGKNDICFVFRKVMCSAFRIVIWVQLGHVVMFRPPPPSPAHRYNCRSKISRCSLFWSNITCVFNLHGKRSSFVIKACVAAGFCQWLQSLHLTLS